MNVLQRFWDALERWGDAFWEKIRLQRDGGRRAFRAWIGPLVRFFTDRWKRFKTWMNNRFLFNQRFGSIHLFLWLLTHIVVTLAFLEAALVKSPWMYDPDPYRVPFELWMLLWTFMFIYWAWKKIDKKKHPQKWFVNGREVKRFGERLVGRWLVTYIFWLVMDSFFDTWTTPKYVHYTVVEALSLYYLDRPWNFRKKFLDMFGDFTDPLETAYTEE